MKIEKPKQEPHSHAKKEGGHVHGPNCGCSSIHDETVKMMENLNYGDPEALRNSKNAILSQLRTIKEDPTIDKKVLETINKHLKPEL